MLFGTCKVKAFSFACTNSIGANHRWKVSAVRCSLMTLAISRQIALYLSCIGASILDGETENFQSYSAPLRPGRNNLSTHSRFAYGKATSNHCSRGMNDTNPTESRSMSLINIVIHILFASTDSPSLSGDWTIKFGCEVSKRKFIIIAKFPKKIETDLHPHCVSPPSCVIQGDTAYFLFDANDCASNSAQPQS